MLLSSIFSLKLMDIILKMWKLAESNLLFIQGKHLTQLLARLVWIDVHALIYINIHKYLKTLFDTIIIAHYKSLHHFFPFSS